VVVVGQPGGMSAPLFAAADDMGVPRGFITPEAMAQAVEMCGGEVKADAHDALVTAGVSAGLPRLAKPVGGKSGARLRLAALMPYDRELTEEATRASSRLHDLLPPTCPALEAHLGGERIQSQLRLAALARCGGRSGLKKAGRGDVRRRARPKKGMGPAALSRIDELLDAVSRQTVSLPGAEGTEGLVRLEAACLLATLKPRKGVAARRDAALAEMPEAQTLMALPGLGAVTCATFLSEAGGISRFDSAARLAAHAVSRRGPGSLGRRSIP
jgi:transposase